VFVFRAGWRVFYRLPLRERGSSSNMDFFCSSKQWEDQKDPSIYISLIVGMTGVSHHIQLSLVRINSWEVFAKASLEL
jgi:hypothetical protein